MEVPLTRLFGTVLGRYLYWVHLILLSTHSGSRCTLTLLCIASLAAPPMCQCVTQKRRNSDTCNTKVTPFISRTWYCILEAHYFFSLLRASTSNTTHMKPCSCCLSHPSFMVLSIAYYHLNARNTSVPILDLCEIANLMVDVHHQYDQIFLLSLTSSFSCCCHHFCATFGVGHSHNW